MEVEGRLWLTRGHATIASSGQIELLERIAATGSIRQAAQVLGIGYKTAWDAVDAMNRAAGRALVQRAVGGRHGGGARLTPFGQRIVATFRAYQLAHRRFLAELGRRAPALEEYAELIGRLAVRTSARNQWFGRVAAIRHSAGDDEIELRLTGDQPLIAAITRASTRELGLKKGVGVYALVKAPAVRLAAPVARPAAAGGNALAGTVRSLRRHSGRCEVQLTLDGGETLIATADESRLQRLRVARGRRLRALIDPAQVILGVPA